MQHVCRRSLGGGGQPSRGRGERAGGPFKRLSALVAAGRTCTECRWPPCSRSGSLAGGAAARERGGLLRSCGGAVAIASGCGALASATSEWGRWRRSSSPAFASAARLPRHFFLIWRSSAPPGILSFAPISSRRTHIPDFTQALLGEQSRRGDCVLLEAVGRRCAGPPTASTYATDSPTGPQCALSPQQSRSLLALLPLAVSSRATQSCRSSSRRDGARDGRTRWGRAAHDAVGRGRRLRFCQPIAQRTLPLLRRPSRARPSPSRWSPATPSRM